MKKENPTLHDENNLNKAGHVGNAAVGQVFKLGLDVDLRLVVVAIQCDRGAIQLGQKFTRTRLLEWIARQVGAGHEVHTVYEACGFGYTLHQALVGAGAHSIVTTPMRLNLDRRRKTDRLDARELCVRLSRYLEGHVHELKPVRVPSQSEQQRRELGRQREFWKRQLRRLENHGRALRIEFEHETLPGGWAGPRKWKQLGPALKTIFPEPLIWPQGGTLPGAAAGSATNHRLDGARSPTAASPSQARHHGLALKRCSNRSW